MQRKNTCKDSHQRQNRIKKREKVTYNEEAKVFRWHKNNKGEAPHKDEDEPLSRC